MSAVVVFIIFAICLIIAIPISISLGIVAVLPGAFDASFTASAGYVIRSMVGGIDSFPLLAVPMFVLAGILMAHGKISEKLFDVFVYFLGNKRAGIPCAVIITCLFYGAISGSAPASRKTFAVSYSQLVPGNTGISTRGLANFSLAAITMPPSQRTSGAASLGVGMW